MIATPKGFEKWISGETEWKIKDGDRLLLISSAGEMQKVLIEKLGRSETDKCSNIRFVNTDTNNYILGIHTKNIAFWRIYKYG